MWEPPQDSIVRDSARRIVSARVVRRYSVVVMLLALLCIAAALWRSDGRLDETPYDAMRRGATMAPYVVVVFFVALMSAGTTKRIFGFGRSGALGYALTAVLLAAGTAMVGMFEVLGTAATAVVAFVVALATAARGAPPWLVHGAGAFALVFGARQGGLVHGLPYGLEGDATLAALAILGGAGLSMSRVAFRSAKPRA